MNPVPIIGFYSTGAAAGILNGMAGATRSLGGGMALNPMAPYQTPFYYPPSYLSEYPQRTSRSDHALWLDTTSAQRTAGRTTYRGIYFQALEAVTNLEFYISQPTIGSFATQYASIATPIANETSSPGGSFTTPTSGAKTTIGNLAAGAAASIWFRRIVPSSAAAMGWDSMNLVFTATDMSDKTFRFFHHLLSETYITDVQGGLPDGEIRQNDGDIFTITTTGDPAGNLIYVLITGGDRVVPFGLPASAPLVTQQLDQCTRISSTSYQYRWRPNSTGFFNLQFFTAETSWVEERYVQA